MYESDRSETDLMPQPANYFEGLVPDSDQIENESIG